MFGLGRRWPRRTAQLAAAGMLAASGSMFFASTAMAAPGAPAAAAGKVTICHATNSDAKPYVQSTVDIDGSNGSLGKGANDHTSHTGPVWNPTLKKQHISWGDIIPPYTFGNPVQSFPGLNWDAAGQAIWNAGCTTPSGGVVAVSGACTTAGDVNSDYTWTLTATPKAGAADANFGGSWVSGASNGNFTVANNVGSFHSPVGVNTVTVTLDAAAVAAGWTVTQPLPAPATCGTAPTPASATATANCNTLGAHLDGGTNGATFHIVEPGGTHDEVVAGGATKDVTYAPSAGATITVSIGVVQKATATASKSCGGPLTTPSATANADCSALAAHLDGGTNGTTFTITEPGGTHQEIVPGGTTKDVSYASGNGATITVNDGNTVLDSKSAPTNCTGLAAPTVDEVNHCKSGMNLTLSNMNGTADTTFTVTDPDGNTQQVGVRAGQLKKLAFAVTEDTTGTLSVSAPGLAKKSFSYKKDCASVLGEKETRKPPKKTVVKGERAELPFTGFDTRRGLLDGAALLFLGAVLCMLGARRKDEDYIY